MNQGYNMAAAMHFITSLRVTMPITSLQQEFVSALLVRICDKSILAMFLPQAKK